MHQISIENASILIAMTEKIFLCYFIMIFINSGLHYIFLKTYPIFGGLKKKEKKHFSLKSCNFCCVTVMCVSFSAENVFMLYDNYQTIYSFNLYVQCQCTCHFTSVLKSGIEGQLGKFNKKQVIFQNTKWRQEFGINGQVGINRLVREEEEWKIK